MPLPAPRKAIQPGFCPDIPETFSSLEEARNSLDYNWTLCQQRADDFEHIDSFRQGIQSQMLQDAWEVQRESYRATSRSWSNAFQSFFDSNVAMMDTRALQGARVLKINALLATVHLDVSVSTYHTQTCWDELMPKYEELLELATAVVNAQKAADQGHVWKPIFQVDHGIIRPLFSVARRCRDPFLRRRAIALLYSTPVQEGIWDSILTARVAERMMQLEEKWLGEVKCAADVPDRARISDVEVSFDLLARRGYIKFLRLRSLDSQKREPVIDVLEW